MTSSDSTLRSPSTRPLPLAVAAGLTAVQAVAVIAVAVGSMAQAHGRFSVGVGVMLLVYGLLLAAVAWATWRQKFYIRGALVGSAILDLLVAVGSFAANPTLWLAVAAANLTIVVCALLPSSTRALRRARGETSAEEQLPPV